MNVVWFFLRKQCFDGEKSNKSPFRLRALFGFLGIFAAIDLGKLYGFGQIGLALRTFFVFCQTFARDIAPQSCGIKTGIFALFPWVLVEKCVFTMVL